MLWLQTAAAQRARKSQVAVAIALQSVNTKEASNANCVNERCKILRSLNRVFVFEFALCIGASSKDPARFVDLGFGILRNKEAQEYKLSSQETNHNKQREKLSFLHYNVKLQRSATEADSRKRVEQA